MISGAELAYIESAKVRDYLLSHVHPVGRYKAVVFEAFGYRAENWEKLHDDLITLARTHEAVAGQQSAFGQKYEVSGSLRGPNGREARFTCIWLVSPNDGRPKFITAFPG